MPEKKTWFLAGYCTFLSHHWVIGTGGRKPDWPESGWVVSAGHSSKAAGITMCSSIKCFLSKSLLELTPHAQIDKPHQTANAIKRWQVKHYY